MTVVVIDRDRESAKAPEKRALTAPDNTSGSCVPVTVVIEKPSFLKLNKKGGATTTTSCHVENESTL